MESKTHDYYANRNFKLKTFEYFLSIKSKKYYPNGDNQFDQRLNAEWIFYNACYDVQSISLRRASVPSSLDTLAFGADLIPGLLGYEKSKIARSLESHEVRFYRQMAESQSTIQKRKIKPTELIDKEIGDLKSLLESGENHDEILRRISKLEKIRTVFAIKRYTENTILRHDVFNTYRPILPNSFTVKNNYIEYILPDKRRAIRIRLLHPDPPEHSTGADLIYECCWQSEMQVRLVFIQYKMYEGDTFLKSSTKNLQNQLDRLKKLACEGGLCRQNVTPAPPRYFRFPYCAAFFRPTDRFQPELNRTISKGFYIPICVFNKIIKDSSNKDHGIHKSRFREKSISHRVFEEMFGRNMIGSTWLDYKQVENTYQRHGIIELTDSIIIHVQEYDV